MRINIEGANHRPAFTFQGDDEEALRFLNLSALARHCGINYSTLLWKMKVKKMTLEEALQ
ncbi:hypothetical protein [Sodalis sp. RH20]|uniref:hypothetical protein n=1 Tax=unclassified Sodalis (in: enterobacteria) TaxID=2636512 RepID=UPI0039B6858B